MKYFFYLLVFTSFLNQIYAQTITKLSYEELDSLMLIEYKKGDYVKAIPYMEMGSDKAKAAGLDSLYAEFISNLGLFYSLTNQPKKAEEVLLEAITLRKKILGEDHAHYAQSLDKLARLYNDLGQLKKAKPLYIKALGIKKKTLGEEDPSYVISLNNLASLYTDMQHFEKAEILYKEALEIDEKKSGTEHENYAVALMNLGNLYREIADYEKAEDLFIKAKNIFLKTLGESHPYYVTILSHLGGLYKNIGAYEKAEVLFLQTIDLDKKNLGTEDPYYAMSINNLASLYSKNGANEKAEKLYLEAIAINQKVYGKVHPNFIINLKNLAENYASMNKHEKAIALNLEVIELTSALYGKESATYAENLENLGRIYTQVGQYSKAEKLLLEAKAIYTKTLGIEDLLYLDCLNNLAELYSSMERLDTALYYSLLSIKNNSTAIDGAILDFETFDISPLATYDYNSSFRISTSLQTLLDILQKQYTKTGDKKKLEQHFKLSQVAMELNERFRNSLAGEEDKLRILRTNTFFIKHGIKSAVRINDAEHIKEAFRFAELNKSVLLLDAVKGNRARNLGNLPDSLVAQEIGFQNEKSILKKQAHEAKTAEEKAAINKEMGDLQSKIDAFLKLVKNKYPKYHQLKYANVIASAEDIQASLDDKSLLLEYFLTDSLIYLFAVSKTKVELYPINIELRQLKKQITNLHMALSNYSMISKYKDKNYEMYSQTALWLYENILRVALSEKSFENLIIITDGELGHLPFETFLIKSPKDQKANYRALHYLINDYNISYNYSATLWKSTTSDSQGSLANSERKNNGQILACAADYSPIDSNTSVLRLPFYNNLRAALKPIPATVDEINSLSDKFQGVFLEGNATNERYFKNNVSNYSVIHLAMHGILNARVPMLSALAFTENGDSIEDNFLQAYEIARLNLNADLVVLSACETGYGKFEQGNGIASLARSFMYAGASSLIVSLWQVNDYATSEIMKNLYNNLADGLKKDEALRQAKIQYMETAEGMMAHPAFWSPFIQVGNTEPVYIKRKGRLMIWGVGGVIGLLVLGGAFMMKRSRKE